MASSSSTLQLQPVGNYVHVRTVSLVLRPQITAFCLGMRLAHTISVSMYVMQVPSLCLAQAWGRHTMLWQSTGKMLSTNKSCLVPLIGFHFTIKLHTQVLTAVICKSAVAASKSHYRFILDGCSLVTQYLWTKLLFASKNLFKSRSVVQVSTYWSWAYHDIGEQERVYYKWCIYTLQLTTGHDRWVWIHTTCTWSA